MFEMIAFDEWPHCELPSAKDALLNPTVQPSWVRPTTGYDQYLYDRFCSRNSHARILGLDPAYPLYSFQTDRAIRWLGADPSERVIKLPKLMSIDCAEFMPSEKTSAKFMDLICTEVGKMVGIPPSFMRPKPVARWKRPKVFKPDDKADADDMLIYSCGVNAPGKTSTAERLERKNSGIASHHRSFYDVETRNRRLATAETHLRRQLELKAFDFIVTCGAGSVAFGAALADRLSIDMMTVRKVGENTGAAATNVIGISDRMATPLRWVFVDDSIHSGDTIRHVLRLMNIHRPRWPIAGVYLHECENVDYMNSMTDFVYSDGLMCLPNYAHPCHNVTPSQ